MERKHIIGIVGGMGPYAGLDLAKKVFDNTIAVSDQEHLPLVLVSTPEEVEDRTRFLLGESVKDPAKAIFPVIASLEQFGATVAGIPCNAAHAPEIFGDLQKKIKKADYRIRLLHMIEEVVNHLQSTFPALKSIGLLSTTGTVRADIYPPFLEPKGFVIITPDKSLQESVIHDAIYNPNYGIKAQANPVTSTARENLLRGIDHLHAKGAEAIILGCTEIPLAIPEQSLYGLQLIDPTVVLARALIRETYPQKLLPPSNI